jgi:hypothetical protein
MQELVAEKIMLELNISKLQSELSTAQNRLRDID